MADTKTVDIYSDILTEYRETVAKYTIYNNFYEDIEIQYTSATTGLTITDTVPKYNLGTDGSLEIYIKNKDNDSIVCLNSDYTIPDLVDDMDTNDYTGNIAKVGQESTTPISDADIDFTAVAKAAGTWDEETKTLSLQYKYDKTVDGVKYGAAQEPSIIVKMDGDTLAIGSDYTVTYVNNTELGTASIYIVGLTYPGTAYLSFNIVEANICDFVNDATQEYKSVMFSAGVYHKPSVSITGLDNYVDYTVAYEDNLDAGVADILITGINNYTNTIEDDALNSQGDKITGLHFTILPYDLSNADDTISKILSRTSFNYDGNTHMPIISLYHNNIIMTGADVTGKTAAEIAELECDYTYDFATDLLYKYTDAEGTETEKTVTKEETTEVGEYVLTLHGKNNYEGTTTVSWSVQPMTITDMTNGFTINVINSALTYNGKAQTPDVEIKRKYTSGDSIISITLVKDTDYTLEYSNNINASYNTDNTIKNTTDLPTVTITGKGNYTGTVDKEFIIYQYSLTKNVVITATDDIQIYPSDEAYELTYDPSTSQLPAIKTITAELVSGETAVELNNVYDYTIESEETIEVGEYTMIVDALPLGNYADSVTVNYEIVKRDIEDLTIKIDSEDGIGESEANPYVLEYTASNQYPVITIINNLCATGTKTLVADTDFTVTYQVSCKDANITRDNDYNSINNDVYTITITGINNYTGTTTYYYTITPIDINEVITFTPQAGVTVDANNYQVFNYTGSIIYAKYDKTYINSWPETLVFNWAKGTNNYWDIYGYYFDETPSGKIKSINPTNAGKYVLVMGGSAETALTWKNSEGTEFTVEFTGKTYASNPKQNYNGLTTIPIIIKEKSLADDDVVITLDDTELLYNGTAQIPEFTVTYNNMTLVKDTDYTVTASNNTNAGTAILTITAVDGGNYTGSKTINFTISAVPFDNTKYIYMNRVVGDIDYYVQEYTPTGNLLPHVTVKILATKTVLTEGVDYNIVPYTSDDPVEMHNAGRYTYKVVPATSNYSGSRMLYFYVAPLDISDEVDEEGYSTLLSLENSDLTYNGTEQTPEVLCDDDMTGMYTTTCDTAVNANNTATPYYVTVTGNCSFDYNTKTFTGTGNYTGTIKLPFNIVAVDVNDVFTVTVDDDRFVDKNITEFTGVTIYPNITIVNSLDVDTYSYDNPNGTSFDYVTYALYINSETGESTKISKENSINAGNYRLVISGSAESENETIAGASNKNYKGHIYIDYTIAPYNLSKDATAEDKLTITINASDKFVEYHYNSEGDAVEPTIKSIIFAGTSSTWYQLTANDYEITGYSGSQPTWQNDPTTSVEPITNYSAAIYIEGKNNFTGTRSVPYVITCYNINNCILNADALSSEHTYFNYDGNPHYPTMYDEAKTLIDKYVTVIGITRTIHTVYLTINEHYKIQFTDANGELITDSTGNSALPTTAGKYYEVIIGINGYTGTRKIPFSIVENIKSQSITGKAYNITAKYYTGNVNPSVIMETRNISTGSYIDADNVTQSGSYYFTLFNVAYKDNESGTSAYSNAITPETAYTDSTITSSNYINNISETYTDINNTSVYAYSYNATDIAYNTVKTRIADWDISDDFKLGGIRSVGQGIIYGTTVTAVKNKTLTVKYNVLEPDDNLYDIYEIGQYQFANIQTLTEVTLNTDITMIDMHAFNNCTYLTTVNLPNSLGTIKSYAFANCSSLTYIILPNSINRVEPYAFANCPNLTAIYINNTNAKNCYISSEAFANGANHITYYVGNVQVDNIDDYNVKK